MIFQLPFISSRQHTPFNGIGEYEHFRPFLHSTTLRWSYRAMQGSSVERWQSRVSGLSTDQMLRQIAANGFRGVYIDLRGYLNDEGQVIIEEIQSITGADYIVSEHGFMKYFYIGAFADHVHDELTESDRIRYRWDTRYPVVEIGEEISVSNEFQGTLISGWSSIEDWGVWSDGHTAALGFALQIEENLDLELFFDLNTFPDPTSVTIIINDTLKREYLLTSAL